MTHLAGFMELGILVALNSLSIFLIIVVLANGSGKHNTNTWFFLMGFFLMGWTNCAYLGYSLNNPSSATLAYHLNDVFVALFLLATYYYYIEGFLEIKNIASKALHHIVIFIFIPVALFTNFSTSSVLINPWGNEAVSGPAFILFSLYALLFSITLLVLFIYKYQSYTEARKEKVKYFLIGTALLIIFNVLFNVLSPLILGTNRYQHFGDYSAIFFLGFSAYAIVGRKFMDVRIALTATLIGIIGVFIVADILILSHSFFEQGIKIIILILFTAVSILLVRNVLNEIKQREELAKANEALEINKQKLTDLATEQRDIIDVMGHEIRTPLTAIVQEVKIHTKFTLPIEKQLLEEANSQPNLKKILPYLLDTVKIVNRASAHAVALVTDMLETARLDKKRFELNYEKFDLIDTISANVELMKKSIPVEEISKYEISFQNNNLNCLEIEADKTRINQAVYALLNNAIKYQDPLKDRTIIHVNVMLSEKYAEITIKDNGIGIAKEDISKLGKKFMRLTNKTTGNNLVRPSGTGLGLFVVKGIMDCHKGTLSITSEGLNHGSTFSLLLPIKKP